MPNVAALSSGDFNDASLIRLNANTSTARNGTATTSFSNTGTLASLLHGILFSSKGIYRYAVAFDLGGNDITGASISGTVASASLVITTGANLTGFSSITANTSNTLYLCKMSGYGSDIDSDDFNALDGWVSSGSYDGNVTLYEDGNVTEAASSTLTFTLNSTAIADINSAISSGSKLPMMLLCEDDFLYETSTGGLGTPEGTYGFFTGEGVRVNTANASSGAPYLSLTYGASGYGHDVSGVSNASIKKVNNIPRASVSSPHLEKISGSE